MSLFNTECRRNDLYSLSSKILNNKLVTETSKNINHKSGTVNDLNFAYQQQLLNNSRRCADSINTTNLLKNKKMTTNFLDILNISNGISGNIGTFYSLAENINLDKSFDELLNGMNKATKTVKSIFKGLL